MDLKRKMKAFFTFDRRGNHGFTLVELIVVIAIMAILGGVGSAGYAGYIKSANKNNDKVLVGNIMRAIETGVSSSMYTSDDSFKMGSISYPVGIVVVSADGTEIISSKTPQANADVGSCKFQTITVSYPVKADKVGYCEKDSSKTKQVYKWNNQSYSCCMTHTSWLSVGADTGKVASYAFHTCNDDGCNSACSSWTPGAATNLIAGDGYYVSDQSDICTPSSQAGLCQVGYANQYGVFEDPVIETAETGDPIYDSLIAAFGDLSGLKLTYDKWTADDGLGYPSFYSSEPQLMEDIESLSDLLAAGSLIAQDQLGLSQKYNDGDEVLAAVSNNIIATHTDADLWSAQWNNDSKMTWDSYGFGLAGRENYSAVRVAYNNAFASYMEANGLSSTYADVIRDFNSQEVAGVGLPGLVCTDAFTATDSPLPGKLEASGASAEDIAAIQELYQKYVESDDCAINGAAFYDTIDTFADTADVANAYADMNGGTIYDYYGSYVDELSAMYSEAQSRAGDGIVIIVTIENGKLAFQVSPGAANPRND